MLPAILRACAAVVSCAVLSPAMRIPGGQESTDWDAIAAEYQRNRFTVLPVQGGWQAANANQQWVADFDGRGFAISPAGAPWRWGLQVASYGLGDQQMFVQGKARGAARAESLTYEWGGGFQEWFHNQTTGLEHGFRLQQRPPGRGPLRIYLAVRGPLGPSLSANGVRFTQRSGEAAMEYTGLKAWDANGAQLPSRMRLSGGMLILEVEQEAAAYPITIDPLAQQAYLKASDTASNDQFGSAVAASGDLVVVGAPGQFGETGAAYVFARSGGAWTQQAVIRASNAEPGDLFGYSVAISGNTVVVGAFGEDGGSTGVNGDQSSNGWPGSGAAYVFVRSGSFWTQQAYLKSAAVGTSDGFGCSVAISGDTAVVGAFGEDGAWGQPDTSTVGDSGAAYVFTRTGSTWQYRKYLKAWTPQFGEWFGWSVAISGDTIIVGAIWTDSGIGAAYVFQGSGGVWTDQARLRPPVLRPAAFGGAVAISGDTAVVGAPDENNLNGFVYVYQRSAGNWSRQATLTETAFSFGKSVAVSGDVAVAGAEYDSSTASNSGAAYVYRRSGTTWAREAFVKASNPGQGDRFGVAVAASGDLVVAGAKFEDSAATGVNGSQSDNSAPDAGAAYVLSDGSGGSGGGGTAAGLRFVPMVPCRLVDTRAGEGTSGNFGPPTLAAAATREIPVPSGRCAVPATALAYSLNATVIPREAVLGYLSLWPTGSVRPLVSTLNSLHGGVVANAAIVPAGVGGSISTFVTNQSDLILDINGYFDAANGQSFYALNPCRVADTRFSAGGGFGAPALIPNQARDFAIHLAGCGAPATAGAYSLNLTVVPGEPLGFLTAWPGGQARPFVSTLNSFDAAIAANAAIVPAGAGGAISLFATHRTEAILDINGYFGQPGGINELRFYPVAPCRLADTRGGGAGSTLEAGEGRAFQVAGNCNIPAGAQAYSLNVTVVPEGPLGYLTLWPTGRPRPFVSTLNSLLGRVVANAAIVPAGANGTVSVYVTDRSEVILDINGYFQ